jgi:hypothetical protein
MNFETMGNDGYYYVDKTKFIEPTENELNKAFGQSSICSRWYPANILSNAKFLTCSFILHLTIILSSCIFV